MSHLTLPNAQTKYINRKHSVSAIFWHQNILHRVNNKKVRIFIRFFKNQVTSCDNSVPFSLTKTNAKMLIRLMKITEDCTLTPRRTLLLEVCQRGLRMFGVPQFAKEVCQCLLDKLELTLANFDCLSLSLAITFIFARQIFSK